MLALLTTNTVSAQIYNRISERIDFGKKCPGEQGIFAFVFEEFITYQAIFRDEITKTEFDKQITEWRNLIGSSVGLSLGKEEREKELEMNRQTKEVSVCGFSEIEFGNLKFRSAIFSC